MQKEIDPNRVPLEPDFQELYFHKVIQAFSVVRKVYDSQTQAGNSEAAIVSAYLEKLLWTLMALRIKHRAVSEPAKIDASDSGFVNFYELAKMESELAHRDELLADLPRKSVLKSQMLDYMFQHRAEPEELLKKISERSYLEMLHQDQLFMQFNHGKLGVATKLGELPLLSYYWACFDSETNRPFIYIMLFEDSGKGPSLLEDKSRFEAFCKVVKGEGCRVPKLSLVAAAIDDRLENIHPKVIKRICIGPFYSHTFSDGFPQGLAQVLENGEEMEKYALYMEHEHVFSQEQVVSKSVFSKDKLREIYFVPQHITHLYEKGLSGVERYVILPHKLHQHAADIFEDRRVISFDKQGELHGIRSTSD